MGVAFPLIRDTPHRFLSKESNPPQRKPKPPPRHGVADDATRLAGGRLAARDAGAAARADVRPRHGLRVRRRRARPLGARERAADAQPIRDRVGAARHQLHRHEARLRRGLGRRHRQDRELLAHLTPSRRRPISSSACGCVTKLAVLFFFNLNPLSMRCTLERSVDRSCEIQC